MVEHLYKCPSCQHYTLEKECPQDHSATFRPLPAKLSFPDKYGKYRQEARKEQLHQQGFY